MPPSTVALMSPVPIRVEDLVGKVVTMSKDQNGCRLLQQKLDDGHARLRELIYQECLPYLAELMVDPFGNYLFQKLLEMCDAASRLTILRAIVVDDPLPVAGSSATETTVEEGLLQEPLADGMALPLTHITKPGAKLNHLVRAALNLHGTRSVQKLVDVCRHPEEVELLVAALSPWVVHLSTDANGNHVIQRCLQHLPVRNRAFIVDAVKSQCLIVARHRHGCCVLQRCLDAGMEQQREALTAEVVEHALLLMQDPFGNYVIQYILQKGTWEQARSLMSKLPGHMQQLSAQKFSSNVVEKCLQMASVDLQETLIRELCSEDTIGHMLHDQYGNYVVQRALSVASTELGMEVVEAIRPHLASLTNTSGGRRITARILKKFPDLANQHDLLH